MLRPFVTEVVAAVEVRALPFRSKPLATSENVMVPKGKPPVGVHVKLVELAAMLEGVPMTTLGVTSVRVSVKPDWQFLLLVVQAGALAVYDQLNAMPIGCVAAAATLALSLVCAVRGKVHSARTRGSSRIAFIVLPQNKTTLRRFVGPGSVNVYPAENTELSVNPVPPATTCKVRVVEMEMVPVTSVPFAHPVVPLVAGVVPFVVSHWIAPAELVVHVTFCVLV